MLGFRSGAAGEWEAWLEPSYLLKAWHTGKLNKASRLERVAELVRSCAYFNPAPPAKGPVLSNVMDQRQGQEGLGDFIRQNEAAIIKEWVEFARTISPAGDKMSKLALEDHFVDILKFVADDLESAQTPREQLDKSRGKGPKSSGWWAGRHKF